MGSPNGSRPDLEGIGYRASTIEEKINEFFVQNAKLPPLMQSISRFENSVQTLSHTVARMMRKSQISNKWLAALQPVLPHWKRMQQPSPVDPAQQDLGTCLDRVLAPQPLNPSNPMNPGSSDDNRSTRRRLDTFSSSEDEQSRSAVLLRFPCEQYHKGITIRINDLWERSNMPAYNKPVRIHCKAGSVSVRIVFGTRAKFSRFCWAI